MPRRRTITPAMEDYLEAILGLSSEAGVARVRDIASSLGVTQSSVTGALRQLADRKLVNYRPYEVITLTASGREAARRVTNTHGVVKRFLRDVLGVSEEIAEADACRIEHGVSRETILRLAKFLDRRKGARGTGSRKKKKGGKR